MFYCIEHHKNGNSVIFWDLEDEIFENIKNIIIIFHKVFNNVSQNYKDLIKYHLEWIIIKE